MRFLYEVEPKEVDEYGKRYQMDLLVEGVNGQRQAVIRIGWIVKPISPQLASLTTVRVLK